MDRTIDSAFSLSLSQFAEEEETATLCVFCFDDDNLTEIRCGHHVCSDCNGFFEAQAKQKGLESYQCPRCRADSGPAIKKAAVPVMVVSKETLEATKKVMTVEFDKMRKDIAKVKEKEQRKILTNKLRLLEKEIGKVFKNAFQWLKNGLSQVAGKLKSVAKYLPAVLAVVGSILECCT